MNAKKVKRVTSSRPPREEAASPPAAPEEGSEKSVSRKDFLKLLAGGGVATALSVLSKDRAAASEGPPRTKKRCGRGIHANAAMAIDPHLKNTCLEDLVGGSVSFYDSLVRLVKV